MRLGSLMQNFAQKKKLAWLLGLSTLVTLVLLFFFLDNAVARFALLSACLIQAAGSAFVFNSCLQKQDNVQESERKVLEAQLSEWKLRERSILEQAVDVICCIGVDQKFISVNKAVLKAWGYEPEELTGKEFIELLPLEDRQAVLTELIGTEKSADTLNFESRLIRKDGKILHVLWSSHWSAADRALFCVIKDISERKQSEMLLRESEARIKEIVAFLPVGLLTINRSGYIEECNQAILDMTEYTEAEIIGKYFAELLEEIEKDFKDAAFSNLLKEKSSFMYPGLLLKQKSGAQTPVQLTLTRTFIRMQEKFLLVVVDIREREEAEKLKRQFLAMVSHDLRSPLTSLSLALSLLTRESVAKLTDKGKALVETNQAEVSRLIGLVNELLDLEKMRSGKFQLHLQNTDINELVASSFAAVAHIAENRSLKLNYSKSNHACYCDGARIIQVLVNLISNAIKVSPAGSSVNLELRTDGDYVLFSVSDSGTGIAKTQHEIIFEAYEQGDEKGRKKGTGTGLGLPICKAIIEQHGGRIWVESEEGKGSKFCFSLKAAKKAAKEPDDKLPADSQVQETKQNLVG